MLGSDAGMAAVVATQKQNSWGAVLVLVPDMLLPPVPCPALYLILPSRAASD